MSRHVMLCAHLTIDLLWCGTDVCTESGQNPELRLPKGDINTAQCNALLGESMVTWFSAAPSGHMDE